MKRGIVNNSKGLSAIVATLLIILLTLIAVGIIWAVIRNVVEGGSDQIELSTKCTDVQLSLVTAIETATNGVYDITLRRGSDSQGDIGVRVNILQGTTAGGVMDWGVFGDLDALGTVTKTITTAAPTLIADADKVEFTVFFQDASGNRQLCPQSGSEPI